MKHIRSVWAHSLQTLGSKQLIQFGLLAFRAVTVFLKDIFFHQVYLFFFVIIGLIALIANISLYGNLQSFTSGITQSFIVCLYALYVGLWLLGLRPSVIPKNTSYFAHYAVRSIVFFLLCIFSCMAACHYIVEPLSGQVVVKTIVSTVSLLLLMPFYAACGLSIWHIILLGLAPFFVFSYLFVIDAAAQIGQFLLVPWRSLKMCLYAYPVIAMLYALLYIAQYMVQSASWFIATPATLHNPLGLYIVLFFCLPLYFACLVNIYIDEVHTHYDLYY